MFLVLPVLDLEDDLLAMLYPPRGKRWDDV
jgi:hypothetical protein